MQPSMLGTHSGARMQSAFAIWKSRSWKRLMRKAGVENVRHISSRAHNSLFASAPSVSQGPSVG
jgi:NAD-dependent oxidoreductase involved in siderophore biosynthesis